MLSHNRIAQRTFGATCGCNVPPGKVFTAKEHNEHDIYKAIETLMAEYPGIKRWAFKMNHEPGGRGIAYFGYSDLTQILKR
jgi:hypothetical protein